ncbi:MAG: TetR/AcrR family transcriptional regulator [Thermoleophilales bacterium]|nr:TetR/AcrR family transcriptional regulator [Thermoleophilales bacterium]
MGDATAPDWNPDPLPRGRHRLPADVVRASQRERLLRAMLALVAENGYHATSVPDVVTRARVSRSAFYQEFDGKLDCFLVLCDERSRGMIEEVLEAAGDFGDRPWQEVIAGGMDAYLRWWRDRPEFARAFLVELPTVGTVGLEYRSTCGRSNLFAGLARYTRAPIGTCRLCRSSHRSWSSAGPPS